jgi:hypothetical protein
LTYPFDGGVVMGMVFGYRDKKDKRIFKIRTWWELESLDWVQGEVSIEDFGGKTAFSGKYQDSPASPSTSKI